MQLPIIVYETSFFSFEMSGDNTVTANTMSEQDYVWRHYFWLQERSAPYINESTVDQWVLHQPLVPSTTSTPIAQTHSQPTHIVTTEVLGFWFWKHKMGKVSQLIVAQCTCPATPSCSLQTCSLQVALIYPGNIRHQSYTILQGWPHRCILHSRMGGHDVMLSV